VQHKKRKFKNDDLILLVISGDNKCGA